jgi:hypothetical protein
LVDLLVYNKNHWYDETTQKIRDEVDAKWPGKFAARYQRGDIVEVVPYRRYSDQRSPAFAVISIEENKNMAYLAQVQMDGNTIIKKRQYQVDLTQISLDAWNQATVATIADAHIKDKITDSELSSG